jgi:hypothetical protein
LAALYGSFVLEFADWLLADACFQFWQWHTVKCFEVYPLRSHAGSTSS